MWVGFEVWSYDIGHKSFLVDYNGECREEDLFDCKVKGIDELMKALILWFPKGRRKND